MIIFYYFILSDLQINFSLNYTPLNIFPLFAKRQNNPSPQTYSIHTINNPLCMLFFFRSFFDCVYAVQSLFATSILRPGLQWGRPLHTAWTARFSGSVPRKEKHPYHQIPATSAYQSHAETRKPYPACRSPLEIR